MNTLSIVLFFVGLLVVILVHEAAHYSVARLFGFKVEEYFVGFGPKVWSFRRGEIEYGVKALPLGGYVKIAGMNPYEPVSEEDLPRAYGSKPRWQRALVIFSGPASHFVVAFVLFFLVFAVNGDPSGATAIGAVTPRLDGQVSPAAASGMRAGDLILAVGPVQNPTFDQISIYQKAHVGAAITYTVLRDGHDVTLSITPVRANPDGNGARPMIGVILTSGWAPVSILGAVPRGLETVGATIKESVVNIGQVFGPHGWTRLYQGLFEGSPRQITDPVSVIGVGQQVGQAGAAGGLLYVLYLLALVTVFIGLINLLPLPPFDGGHLAVIALEKIRGKSVDPRRLIPISVAVMGTLAVFVLATAFLDIFKPVPGP
ncbi:MAG: site-2 protease family protein [Actinomycetota bacterium]